MSGYWHGSPGGAVRGVVIHLHGLEADAESGHMRGISLLTHQAGFASLRLDWLGCGASGLTAGTMYHALRWLDLEAAVGWVSRRLPGLPVFLTGLSLGGAVALRWLSEMGEAALPMVKGVVTISAPVDLGAAARAVALPGNRIYERWFLASMKRRLEAAARRDPSRWGAIAGLGRAASSLAGFDDDVTARLAGQPDAQAYYRLASPRHALSRLKVPAFLIHAADDPFVPPPDDLPDHVRLILHPSGGHGGFWMASPKAFGPRITTDRWAEGAAVRWIQTWA
ncbi:MAG: alpha/beta fold hydrolase [Candidatus Sericytochromatia bacterium]|nr:alpha/beta fold hydrolase [Candidatus Sericytochromatia bacterium]